MKKITFKETGKKAAAKAKILAAGASAAITSLMFTVNAYALDIDTDYTVTDVGTDFNIEGLIIGLALWLCRLVGVGMLIWGIYGYVTARKDGEAEAMNGSLGKLISGAVLIGMPSVLQAIGLFG